MIPVVSVIIPVYNVATYLARCLGSVVRNTYHELEIICVDDGSTDQSLEILRRYEEEDARIIVITKENGGVSSARNAGLRAASGDFIAFVDSDDFIHPQYFELLLQTQKQTSADLVVCDYQSIKEDDRQTDFSKQQFDAATIIPLNRKAFFQKHLYRSYVWSKLFRREIVSEVSFRDGIRYAEDAVFVAEVWEKSPNIKSSFISAKLYAYFDREGSLVHTVEESSRLLIAKLFAEKAADSHENEQIYLEQAVRRLLACRYMTAYILPDKTIEQESNIYLKQCTKQVYRSNEFSGKKKLMYHAFCVFPRLYWLFRSITEPNMWRWERVERKKRRENAKQ